MFGKPYIRPEWCFPHLLVPLGKPTSFLPCSRLSSICRYFHRNLNPAKLADIGFSPLGRNQTISRLVRHYAVPSHPKIPGFREMVLADVPQVGELLRRYLSRFEIIQTFSRDDEVEHWFLSGQGREENGKRVEQVVWAYVVEVSRVMPLGIDAHRSGPDNTPHH